MYKKIRDKKPIIHCITNYVTVNDVANMILAIGAAPIMSDDIDEIEEIVTLSNALVINVGTLNKRTIESMIYAGKCANKKRIPVVLDPVGCGASNLRTDTVKRLIDELDIAVIKGNMSEVYSLSHNAKNSTGVDVGPDLQLNNKEVVMSYLESIKKLAIELNTVIAVTGKIDIVTDGTQSYLVYNGVKELGDITGTGCMAAGMIGGFIASNNDICLSTAKAISLIGQAGEYAKKNYKGLGKFKVDIFNGVSLLSTKEVEGIENIETL